MSQIHLRTRQIRYSEKHFLLMDQLKQALGEVSGSRVLNYILTKYGYSILAELKGSHLPGGVDPSSPHLHQLNKVISTIVPQPAEVWETKNTLEPGQVKDCSHGDCSPILPQINRAINPTLPQKPEKSAAQTALDEVLGDL